MRNRGPASEVSTRVQEGFSLLELMASVLILTILMGIVFVFLDFNQRHYRSQQLLAEVNQGGRSAFEVMTQEINQAGYNPPFRVNKTVGGSTGSIVTPGSPLVSLPVASATTPATQRIFYGSRLVIGNSCTGTVGTCNQEEVVVNQNTSSGTTAMTTTTIPVDITFSHAAGEPIYARNYPYPTGILYDNRTAGTGLAIAGNSIKFFGDIMNTGYLYYEEYRLQCPGATAGTYINACTTGCTTGPFTLTRFITKLADPTNGFFKIPANKASAFDSATASPLVDNVIGTCPTPVGTAPANWTVYNAPDETTGSTVPVNAAISYVGGTNYVTPVLNPDGTPTIWWKVNTYGSCDTSTNPCTPLFQTFVLDIRIALTIQESQIDPATNTYRTELLQAHIVPRNTNDALVIAVDGGSSYLPPTPIDPSTGNTLPLQ